MPATILTGSGGLLVQRSDPTPLFDSVVVPVFTGGSSSTSSYYDAEIALTTNASNYNNYQLSPDFGVDLTNLTPSIASLSEGNFLQRLTDGYAMVVGTRGGTKSRITFGMRQTGGYTVRQFAGFSNGSSAKSVSDDLLSLWDEGKTNPLFSSINHTTGAYTKNPNGWAYDLDLSGVAVAMALNGTNWSQANAPIMITPRHCVCVRHWGFTYTTSTKVRCIGNDNVVYERNVAGASSVLKSGGLFDDLVVLTLQSAMPDEVVPFSVAGEWIRQGIVDSGENGLNSVSQWLGGVGFAINQNFNAVGMFLGNGIYDASAGYLRNVTLLGTSLSALYTTLSGYSGATAVAIAGDLLSGSESFFADIVTGDSGKPVFVLNATTPILAYLFTTAQYGAFVGCNDGDVANHLIASADSNGGVSTGLTVAVATDPTL